MDAWGRRPAKGMFCCRLPSGPGQGKQGLAAAAHGRTGRHLIAAYDNRRLRDEETGSLLTGTLMNGVAVFSSGLKSTPLPYLPRLQLYSDVKLGRCERALFACSVVQTPQHHE